MRNHSPRYMTKNSRARWLMLSMALVGSCLLGTFGWREQPAMQFQRALDSLQSHDWERLQYRQLALARRQGYEPHNSLLIAALQIEQRQIEPALRELRYARRHPDTRALAFMVTGEANYARSEFREAELNFKRALFFDPQLADAHRWLAVAYYDIGLMHEAVLHLQQVADLDPADPSPHRIMAVIHMDLGNNAIAVENLQESLRRDAWQPDRQEILIELAQSEISLKRFKDAQQTLSECEESADSLALLANCCYALGDAAQARQLAERSLEAGPRQRLAIMVLGNLAFDQRNYQRAVEMLSRAAEQAPTDYELRYSFVTALRAAGHTDQAEEELQAVEELHRVRQEFDELLQRAIEEPYEADIRYQLGLLADRMKMARVAESWFKAAVSLDPRHRLARNELQKRGSTGIGPAAIFRGS